jgi:NitT/TauT family transport system ATP-binding protein
MAASPWRAIVRALVHKPSLLLMDEPFASVDALTRDQLNLDLLRLWTEQGATVVFVTHGIDEAVFLGDRVLVMSHRPGQFIADVPVTLPRPRTIDLKDAPEFRAYTREIRKLLEGGATTQRAAHTS